MIEKYKKYLQVITAELETIFEYQQEYICCKEGCSLCCEKGTYPMSQLEYDYLMIGYNELNDSLKANIQQKIDEIKKEENVISHICPFLVDNKCSVYQYRPIVCRAFGLLTEDAKGELGFPFCATLGLSYSNIYDSEKGHLSNDLVKENNFKVPPRFFNLNNTALMNTPIAKELELDFGKTGKMIDFL